MGDGNRLSNLLEFLGLNASEIKKYKEYRCESEPMKVSNGQRNRSDTVWSPPNLQKSKLWTQSDSHMCRLVKFAFEHGATKPPDFLCTGYVTRQGVITAYYTSEDSAEASLKVYSVHSFEDMSKKGTGQPQHPQGDWRSTGEVVGEWAMKEGIPESWAPLGDMEEFNEDHYSVEEHTPELLEKVVKSEKSDFRKEVWDNNNIPELRNEVVNVGGSQLPQGDSGQGSESTLSDDLRSESILLNISVHAGTTPMYNSSHFCPAEAVVVR